MRWAHHLVKYGWSQWLLFEVPANYPSFAVMHVYLPLLLRQKFRISLMWSHNHQNHLKFKISQKLWRFLNEQEICYILFYSEIYMPKRFHDHFYISNLCEFWKRPLSHDWLTDKDSTNQKQYWLLSYPIMLAESFTNIPQDSLYKNSFL